MAGDRHALGPYKETAVLRKWNGPKEGAPDEVMQQTSYYERDHTLVTDPARQAEIDALISGSTETDHDALQCLKNAIDDYRLRAEERSAPAIKE